MGRKFNRKMLAARAKRQCRRPGTRCVCCNKPSMQTHLLCNECIDRMPNDRLAEYQSRRTRWITTQEQFANSLHNPVLIEYQVEAGRCRHAIRRGEGDDDAT